MCSYCKRHKETEVPDPYYGGPQGFEQVNVNLPFETSPFRDTGDKALKLVFQI